MNEQTANTALTDTQLPTPAPKRLPENLGKLILRTVYIVLVMLVAVLLVLGIRKYFAPVPQPTISQIQPITGGKIALLAGQKVFDAGSMVPVTVRIFTGGNPIDGVDLLLRYDPTILEATATGIVNGDIFPEYPMGEIGPANGTIKVSGISGVSQREFNGLGIFATINFKAKRAGKTAVSVDFKPGSTTDSNMIETGSARDILEEVVNLDLTIQ